MLLQPWLLGAAAFIVGRSVEGAGQAVFVVISAFVDFGVADVVCLSCCCTARAINYDEFDSVITVVEVSSVTKTDAAVATQQGMLALCCDCCHH